MLNETVVEAAINDPILSRFDLPRKGRFFPLGFSAEIRTNSIGVLRAAAQSHAAFSQAFFNPAVELSIGVCDDGAARLPEPPVYRSRGHLLSIVSDAQNYIVCDQHRGYAFGWVNQAVVQDLPFFRYYFLDAALFSMLNELYLAPVHGALLERNRIGILLCGESGAGKSTLAFACARRGWTYITDDACFLIRDRDDRFGIGNPHSIRLREDASSHFHELATQISRVRANGKIGIEVFTEGLPEIPVANGSSIQHVVFLNRAEPGPPALKRFSKHEARFRFGQCVSTGDEQVRTAQLNTYNRLLDADFWEIRYRDLADAVALLERLAPGGE